MVYSIGTRVKDARKKAGLTQVELATAAGMSRSYLADVEGGRYNPSVKKLVSIAAACGVDLNFLVDMLEIQTSAGA